MAKHDDKRKRRIMKEFAIDHIAVCDHPAQEPARVAILKRAGDNLAKALPKPQAGEKRDDFISRFMGNSKAKEEYPDHDQRMAVAQRQFGKNMALTSMTAGHAHLIVGLFAGMDGVGERRAGQTSFVDGHAHDWVMDDAGNIIVGEAEGHSHGISVLVQKAAATDEELDELENELEKRTFSAERREELARSGAAMKDGSFPIVNRADLTNAIQAFGRAKNKAAVARHIAKRARALGLTELLPKEGALASFLSKGMDDASNPEAAETIGDSSEVDMTKQNDQAADNSKAVTQKQLDEVEKRAQRAESIVGLSPDQRAHFDTLKGSEAQDEFLAKSTEERDAILKNLRDADPVVYTDRDGNEYRKSCDQTVLRLVQKNDEQAKKLDENEKLAKRAGFEKRAQDELGNLTGTDEAKADLLEAVETLPAEKRTPVLEILKAKDAGMQKAFERVGTRAKPETGSPEDVIEGIAKRIREQDPSLTEAAAYNKALETPEGREAFAELRS